MRKVIALATAGLVLAIAPAVSAQAATPKPVKYKSCTALNKVYKHGVAYGKSSRDHVKKGAKPVTTFVINKPVYVLNYKLLDKDRDGVACEKK